MKFTSHSTSLAVACVVVLFSLVQPANAVIVLFDLFGNAGEGLLPENENHPVTNGGTGGEIGGGITYDTETNLLTINVGWGSGHGQGFTDLSGAVNAMHIHGVTSSPPDGFTEDAGVLINLHTLGGFNGSATNGGLSDSLTLDQDLEANLLNGQLYINAHTVENGGGEIRGQLVPEPSALVMLLFAGAGMGFMRRR